MIVAAALLAPALSLVASELARLRTEPVGRMCLLGTVLGLVLALALIGLSVGGPQPGSTAWLSPRLDRLSAAMLVLVLGVSALVQAYALRNLTGAPEQRRFIRTTALTSSAAALTVTAGHLLLLAIVGQRRELGAAREGLRRAVRSLLVGDVALLLAGALIWSVAGDASLAHLGRVTAALSHTRLPPLLFALPAAPCAAVLLVIAAAARAAQLPGQAWLAATVTTPTPASALLHAGLVNAGGFLLVRLAPVFAGGLAGPALAFGIGLATALYAGTLQLIRPDVKGTLAHSTSAQMGFMLIACGVGAYPAVIVHLIGHGLYKASAFLGADGAVAAQAAKRAAPAPAPPTVPRVTAGALVAGICAGTLAVALLSFARPALGDQGVIVPLAFAWAAAATVGFTLLRRSHLRAAHVLGLTSLACLGYAGLLAGMTAFLHLRPGGGTAALPLVLAAPPLVLGFAAMLVLTVSSWPGVRTVRLRVYPLLLELSSVGLPSESRRPLLLARVRVWRALPSRLFERSVTA